jgi:hypothetical protein
MAVRGRCLFARPVGEGRRRCGYLATIWFAAAVACDAGSSGVFGR